MRKISYPNLTKIMQYLKVQGSTDIITDTADLLSADVEDIKKWAKKASKYTTKNFVITCAQNCSSVNKTFLKAIHRYCLDKEAELIVIPFVHNSARNERWYDPQIEFFLGAERRELNSNLIIMSDLTRTPTVMNPLASREAITGASSGIFPHVKVALKTVPTPQGELPKILVTTGALTLPRYTETSAGKVGEFHHTYGALSVTLDGEKFHQRHLLPDEDGSFYDLGSLYAEHNVTTGHRAEALILGDSHVRFFDPLVKEATFDAKESITKVLKPKKIVHHDLLDQYTRNHHHKGNSLIAVAKAKAGVREVEEEILQAINFLNETTPKGSQAYIIASNHNDALNRWLLESDFREDPDNAIFFLEMNLAMHKAAEITPQGYSSIDPLEFYCRNKTKAIFLKRDKSFMVKDIELGFHGDKGLNGARGSARSFTKIGPKCVIGHSHSPLILNSVYQTGTSSRYNLEYCSGPSSWLQTHCIIYPNGKRVLINIIDGEWK